MDGPLQLGETLDRENNVHYEVLEANQSHSPAPEFNVSANEAYHQFYSLLYHILELWQLSINQFIANSFVLLFVQIPAQ